MGLVETAHLSQNFNCMPHLGTRELTFRIDHWHGRHVLPAMGTMFSRALPLFSKVSLHTTWVSAKSGGLVTITGRLKDISFL